MFTEMHVVETVNGCIIFAQYQFPKKPLAMAGRVIIVDRGEAFTGHQRYCCAVQNLNARDEWDSQWHGGYYHDELSAVFTDFVDRIQDNAGVKINP